MSGFWVLYEMSFVRTVVVHSTTIFIRMFVKLTSIGLSGDSDYDDDVAADNEHEGQGERDERGVDDV